MTVGGLVLLMVGADYLVRGAVGIARALGVSPLVIGLTVVAFGTSAPELGVSLQAALTGNADVAIGNVVGSNIVNILLVLGASAIITPLVVSSQLIRLDVPLMVAASIAMWVLSLNGVISRMEGAVLFGSLLIYIWFSIRTSRRESAEVAEEFSDFSRSVTGFAGTMTQIGLFVAGLGLLTVGSRFLVDGAITVAQELGVSQLVIGLTIVALGTSLPEVVTSVVASLRGQRDIAVGNVVGSNLFNILCVLGLTATVSPNGVPVSAPAIEFDIPVMVAVAVVCLPIFISGSMIRRYEGALFLVYLAAYTMFLIATAKGWGGLPYADAVYISTIVPEGAAAEGACSQMTLPRPPLRFEDGAFFSVTTYSDESWIVEENFALNDRAAEANADGSITFRYNCPGQPNNMDVQPGWTQVIRLYQPESAEAISAYVETINAEVKIEPAG